jgi:hypothetical protein
MQGVESWAYELPRFNPDVIPGSSNSLAGGFELQIAKLAALRSNPIHGEAIEDR